MNVSIGFFVGHFCGREDFFVVIWWVVVEVEIVLSVMMALGKFLGWVYVVWMRVCMCVAFQTYSVPMHRTSPENPFTNHEDVRLAFFVLFESNVRLFGFFLRIFR